MEIALFTTQLFVISKDVDNLCQYLYSGNSYVNNDDDRISRYIYKQSQSFLN